MKYKLIALFLFALSVNAFAAGDLWTSDYEAALKKAKQENRHVLLDFTGSDWCGWCIKLNKEVFSTEAFQEYAKKNLVLIELDFPQRKHLPKQVVAQNKRLQRQFGVNSFPTIWLLNAEGTPVARTGYQAGGGEAYVKHLMQLIKQGK